MVKRIFALLSCCTCLICGKMEVVAAVDQTESEKYSNTELIVLVDTSGSIEGKRREREIQWAKEICVFCDALEMKAAYVYFDDYKEDYGIACSTMDGTDTCIETLTDMPHKGMQTELAGPMKYAISLMNERKAKNKYIVMLSDGDEDLVGRNGRSLEEVPFSEDEINRIEEFKELVKEFDEKDNQEVILVGLEEDVRLFSELKRKQEIQYFSGADGTEESLIHTFELGSSAKKNQGKEDRVGLSFELRNDLELAIFQIQWDGNLENAKDMLRVMFGVDEEEEQKVSNKFLVGNSSMLVYIYEPEGGKYRIELPAKNLRSTIFQLDRIVIEDIELRILKDNKIADSQMIKEGNIELTKYVVENGKIEFLLQPKIEKGDMEKWNPTVMYSICPYQSGMETGKYLEQNGNWKTTDWVKEVDAIKFQVSNLNPETYLCVAKTKTNRQTDCSNMILFQVEEHETEQVITESMTKKVGEEINLKDFISDNEFSKYHFTIQKSENGEEHEFMFDCADLSFGDFEVKTVIDKKLIFRKEGMYKMTIDKEKQIKGNIDFLITRDKKWYERLLDIICFWGK